jgi:hypothetical protein
VHERPLLAGPLPSRWHEFTTKPVTFLKSSTDARSSTVPVEPPYRISAPCCVWGAWMGLAGQVHDLIVSMDDATGQILSAFLVEEEGTMSSFVGCVR